MSHSHINNTHGSALIWDGAIKSCPCIDGNSKHLQVQLWTYQHRHPLSKSIMEALVFVTVVDMAKIPIYMISGGSYTVKSEHEETLEYFNRLVNYSDIQIGILAQIVYSENTTTRQAVVSPDKAKVNDGLPDWVLLYVELDSSGYKGQLHAVCLTNMPNHDKLVSCQLSEGATKSSEKQELNHVGSTETIKREDYEMENKLATDKKIALLQDSLLVKNANNDIRIKQEDWENFSPVGIKDSALEKLHRRRSTSITPFSKAAQKSLYATSNKENIYLRPKLEHPKLERKTSVGKLTSRQSSVQQQKTNASRESSIASDSSNELEKRNMAIVQKVILSELRMRGISRDHSEYKQLYHHTFKALCFALRERLSLGSGIELDEIQEKADKLLSIFIG